MCWCVHSMRFHIGSTWSWRGGLSFIMGSLCLSHILNAELANLSKMYCFNLVYFSGCSAQWSKALSRGGRDRAGQVHLGSPGIMVPVLEQVGILAAGGLALTSTVVVLTVVKDSGSGNIPKSGNFGRTARRAIHISRLRYVCFTLLDTK